MRAIKELLDDRGDIDLEKLQSFLKRYDDKFSEWKKDLTLENRNLRDALVEQASIAAYYDEMKVQLSILMEYIDILINSRSGEVNMMFKENSKFDHSDTSIKLLIGKDPTIIKYKRMRLDVKELYDKISSVCNQFDKRGYTLTNIVKVMVAGLSDVTLTKEDE